ncbi:MAG TPA: hypothetical protein DHV30_05340 [Balneola sp.]|jgi:hypothetical protein|nr:hypothetical protein [Balneola sp.]|tara:strand:+ start:940 stop:1227 length:288 start_codon:yes stop_codon:yes gene_type:complete
MSFNYGLRPTKTQKIASGGSSSAVADVFGTQTEYVRIAADADCHIEFGGNGSSDPTATTSTIFIPADQPEIFKVSPGEKVASIGSANVFVTEMSG